MILPHEGPEARQLRRMPVTVLRKIAETGAVLSEEEFRKLPRVARQRLVDMRVEAQVERRAFCKLVDWLRMTFLGATGPMAPVAHKGEGTPTVWRDDEPPADLGVPPDDWRRLHVDARYALLTASSDERPAMLDAFRGLTSVV